MSGVLLHPVMCRLPREVKCADLATERVAVNFGRRVELLSGDELVELVGGQGRDDPDGGPEDAA